MEEQGVSPLDRLLILTFGAMLSWLAVGGIAFGASRLAKHLFLS